MTKKIYFLLPVFLLLCCGAFCQSGPLTEGFNTVSPSAMPGWSFINRSGGSTVSNWAQGNTSYFSAQSGPANSYIQSFGVLPPQVFISNWLLTPERTLHNGDIITFYTKSLANASEALEVRLTTNGNSSNVGNNVGSTGDFSTLLLTVNPAFTRFTYPTTWTKFTVTLSGLSGTPQGRFAFRHVNQSSPQGGEASVGIDNFTYISYFGITRLYVDGSMAESGNGGAWGSAYKTLNEALATANTYGNISEIWVAKGTYYPDEGPGRTNNDPNLSFGMKNGLAIYGGFAGGETSLNPRDWRTNVTILSGEIQQENNNTGNNADKVIQTNGLNNTAVLDGFTVTAGNANSGSSGISNTNSSPTVTNCTFSNNGRGMDNYSSSPTVTNCIFSSNIFAGMLNAISSPTVTNSIFLDNNSGMSNANSSLTVTNCIFLNNNSGMNNANTSSPTVTNCILWGNTNGPILNINSSTPAVAYSVVQGGYAGNLSANPLFVNANDPTGPDGIFGTADDGLRLQPGSPAVNKGNNSSIPSGISTDITGAPRIRLGLVDMGAYESAFTNIAGTVLHVDSSKASSGDGGSWATAVKTLSEAFDAANTTNSSITAIWVKKGTYYPDEGPGRTNNDRNLSFSLKNGLAIYGGFSAADTTLALRNWQTNVTVLSGEIQQDNNIGNNAYHVIQSSGLNSTAVLDGFIVTAGNANGGGNASQGGGMYNNNSSPSLVNCTFSQNTASDYGGGMNNEFSSPSLVNCSFLQNTSISGGGMYNFQSSPGLVNCIFSQNTAIIGFGGGMYNGVSSPGLVNCIFSQNTATIGGGMRNEASSSPRLVNCILWGNTNSQIDNSNSSSSSPSVSWSIVQGDYIGTNNSPANPLFVNASNPAGPDGIFGTADDGLRLQVGSPGRGNV